MAIRNYDHVYAAAGYSGEVWDVTVGYDREYTSDATAVTFAVTTNKITLSAGTFPAWMQVVGNSFTTDSINNPGPFIIKTVTSTTDITVQEALVAEAAVTVVFDGDKNTLIQDVLLQTGSGALTEHAPLVLKSTGALGAARQLDLSAMEVATSAHDGESLNGRPAILSVQNSDIYTNNLTLVGSNTINGAASFVISTPGDYLVTHFSGGDWWVNVLPRPSEALATIARVPFLNSDWDAGATKDQIIAIQTGSPSAGEVGPHSLTQATTYGIFVFNTDLPDNKLVNVDPVVDPATGDVILKKSPGYKDFNGVIVIVGSLD